MSKKNSYNQEGVKMKREKYMLINAQNKCQNEYNKKEKIRTQLDNELYQLYLRIEFYNKQIYALVEAEKVLNLMRGKKVKV